MRRSLAVLAVSAAVPAALAVDGGTSPGAARSCSGVRVGLLAPLSGPAASYGREQLSWARFALRRWNQENPRLALKLVERDTAYDPGQAQTRAAQLAADPRVMAVVGPTGSQEATAVIPRLRAKAIALISGSARAPELTAGGKRQTFFRVVAPDPAQAPTTADFIRRSLHAQRVWVIDDTSAYSVQLADIAGQQLKDAGVVVTRSPFATGDTFDALLKTMPAGVDVVYLPWRLASRARAFFQQLRTRAKSVTAVGSDRLDSPEWLGGAEGQYYSSFAPDVSAFDDRATKAVWSAYASEYGTPVTNYGPPVFVAVQVAATALRSACADGKTSRAEVLNQVRQVRLPASIIGYPIRFRGGEAADARFWMFRVVSGEGMLVR
jgi:ABC-type branched-subunit amino acid transport system substrate-binding protein